MINESIKIGKLNFENRVVLQPMEGCDCFEDGSPSELTVAKYMRASESCAALVWFEANAVCPEGRTNPGQLMLTRENLPKFKKLVLDMRAVAKEKCGVSPVFILQLTHSGRQSIKPMIAYRNEVYEERRPMSDENIVSDEYLDTLPKKYAESALLAREAGFDGVDIKCCHGYLFQELLSAFYREGRYGGSFENRTKLYFDSIRAVKEAVGDSLLLATRLSVSDMVRRPFGFGTDESGNLDLTEPDMLIEGLVREGIKILNVTIGNPYFNPHINRPYRKGGYIPPESAEVGLERFVTVEKHIKENFKGLFVVASGLSYYRENLIEKSEELLSLGVCDFVGYGRGWIAYPSLYSDYLRGQFNPKKCCLSCSKCTELMRNKKVSGCAVFNPTYAEIYKEIKK